MNCTFQQNLRFILLSWVNTRRAFLEKVKEMLADEKVAGRQTRITSVLTAGIGVIGGVMGVLAIPVTGGASLALTAAAVAVSVAGVGGSKITNIYESKSFKDRQEMLKVLIAVDQKQSHVFSD